MKIAVTRAEPGASATAARLRARGAEPVISPLIAIAARPFDADLSGVQAVLFTSAAGARAFAAAVPNWDIPAFTVGAATAIAARQAGFTDVRNAEGDVAALAALAAGALDPAKGTLIHASGAHVAGDLTGVLRQAGFRAERRIVYEAEAAPSLPVALQAPLDAIMFHSARAAEIFAGFGAPQADLLTAACLSPQVARAARGPGIAWARVAIAAHPNDHALIEAALAPKGANA